jgi:hypothetical protein
VSDAKKPEVTAAPVKSADVNIADLVRQTVEGLLPSLILAAQGGRPAVKEAPIPLGMRPRCVTCNQVEGTGCNGKHVEIAVYPSRDEVSEYFQGVILNGVKYLSNDANHKIPVPELGLDAITSRIIAYEENEVATRNGRKKERRPGQRPVGSGVGHATPADGWR